jgi:acyl carrier protein
MAMPDCTADKLRKLIAGYLGVDASRVTDEAHLSDDLGIEWLDQIELLLIIEDEFAGSSFRTRRRLNSSAICSAT